MVKAQFQPNLEAMNKISSKVVDYSDKLFSLLCMAEFKPFMDFLNKELPRSESPLAFYESHKGTLMARMLNPELVKLLPEEVLYDMDLAVFRQFEDLFDCIIEHKDEDGTANVVTHLDDEDEDEDDGELVKVGGISLDGLLRYLKDHSE